MATDDGDSGTAPVDPRSATTVSELLAQLRLLRTRAGMPAYREIAERIAGQRAARRSLPEPLPSDRPAVSTVADLFTKADRARLDYDLFFALVRALGVTAEQLRWWQEAWQGVFAPVSDDEVEARSELIQTSGVFVGRESELRELLDTAPRRGLIMISGMAGVGKTALALQAGRRLQRRDHPSATLYADLGGFHPSGAPAEPAAVLSRFLRILGARVPTTLDSRLRAYRNIVSNRSALIVLDNAADVDQLLPLLPSPGSPTTVIVTSRTALEVPGAHHVRLGVLTTDESLALLERLTTPERVADEPAAAHELVQHCARLPLALNLIGQHVSATPEWTLADHAARLLELRLDEGVRAAFAVSYRGLDAADSRLFRRLAIHPGVEFDVYAAAALDHSGPAVADEQIGQLVAAHLVQPLGPGRYRMHDLVRAYALERALDDEPASQRSAALTRMLDYYRHTAAMAADRYLPAEHALRPEVRRSAIVRPAFDDAPAALDWLESERDNLVAAARYAADHGDIHYAQDMSSILYRFLIVAGHLDTSVALHRIAAAGSDPGALNRLGTALLRKTQYAEAAGHLERAVAIAQDSSDARLLLASVGNLGLVYERLGRYRDALAMHRRALELACDDLSRSRALLNMGLVELRLGLVDEAKQHTRASGELSQQVNDPAGEIIALLNLAHLQRHEGDYAGALALAEQAEAFARREGHRIHAAANEIGENLAGLGRLDEAVQWQQRALGQAIENGDLILQVLALNAYGRLLTRQGSPSEAIGRHQEALELAEDQQDLVEQWHAHRGLVDAYRGLGDRELCRTHEQRSKQCLARLGLTDPPL